MVSLCILITNSPLGLDPAPSGVVRLAMALLASGALATLLKARVRTQLGVAPASFSVAHSWRRSGAHAVMLATSTLLTSSLVRETTESESQNYGYKFGQEEETYNIVAAHGYFGRLIFQPASSGGRGAIQSP